jgi:hypothetical protein
VLAFSRAEAKLFSLCLLHLAFFAANSANNSNTPCLNFTLRGAELAALVRGSIKRGAAALASVGDSAMRVIMRTHTEPPFGCHSPGCLQQRGGFVSPVYYTTQRVFKALGSGKTP